MAKYVIGPVAALPPGTQQRVTVAGRNVAIWNVGGRFYALRDICPHYGGPLSAGHVVGRISAPRPGCYVYDGGKPLVRCPWHGWEYDLATGQSLFDPVHNRVRAYDVSVEPGSEISAATSTQPGPYVAETIPISVEDDYVVVELSRG